MFNRSKSTGRRTYDYTTFQLFSLVVLRVSIGWHFLYEGTVKLLSSNWSSVGYLMDSKGWFSGIFQGIAMNPQLLKIADVLNMWGLLAIGLGLILGLFTRLAVVSGMVLLLFYYASHPSFIGVEYALPSDGSYLIINKTLIELFALWVLFYFPSGDRIGMDRFFIKK